MPERDDLEIFSSYLISVWVIVPPRCNRALKMDCSLSVSVSITEEISLVSLMPIPYVSPSPEAPVTFDILERPSVSSFKDISGWAASMCCLIWAVKYDCFGPDAVGSTVSS